MKAYKTYLLLFFGLLFGQNLIFAQLSPALMHKQGGESVPLRVNSVEVKVTNVGSISRTEMTLVFYNDLDRILEGKLYFPLAEGQTISAFALDVGNEMREGVVVEKQKGRKVFEDIVRRGIDPGLLEYVKGNNFSARVYPIPAKGTRTIRIAYEEGLSKNSVGFRYRLPLQFAKVEQFSLEVESRNSESEPIVKSGEYQPLVFEKQENQMIGKLEKSDFTPNQTLEIDFPHKGKTFVYQGLGKIQPREYFYASLQPEKFSKPKPLPKKVALVWDISGSAQNRDFEKEFALLKAYFSRLGNVSVDLITFNNELRKTYQFQLQNGNWQEIRKQIEALNYDGGTQLGVLDFPKIEADEILFSSDGFSNLGKLSATILKADGELMQTPIHTISSLRNTEFSYLRHLSESTGGHFLNLNQLSAESALELLKSEPYRFLSASYNSGEISEVFPSKPVAINGEFAISGLLLTEKASITLNFGFNNEVKHSQTIQLNKKGLETDGTVERIWANLQLQELDRKYQENENLISELGTRYSIVTRNTSLIVLENLDDYFRYKIRPPKAVWEEICAKYKLDKDLEWQEVLAKSENRGIKPYLIDKWEKRKDWYFNQEYVLKGKAKETIVPVELIEMYDEIMYDSPAEEDMAFGSDDFGDFEEEIEEEISFDKKNKKKSEKGASAKIKLAPWSATSEYVKRLEAAESSQRYALYLEMKPNYLGNTGFYADVADFFLHQGDTNTALLVASNIAELQLDNHEMLRLLASLLKLCGRYDLAIEAHKQILELRDDEIQSYRDLALAYEGNGNYQLALNTFYEALEIDWVQRRNPSGFGSVLSGVMEEPENGFGEDVFGTSGEPDYFVVGTQQVILEELNRLIGRFGNILNISEIDKDILKKMPVDMRIAVGWDSDNFDMDLWVTDPNGEKCYYGNTKTDINGRYTYDNTSGYGPEEFLLKNAIAGNYKVEMNYYGTRSQKMLAPVTVTVDFFTNYGLQSEEKQTIVLRLGEQKEVVYAGEIEFDPLKPSKKLTFSEVERYEEILLSASAKTFRFSPDESKLAVITNPKEGKFKTRLLLFDVATRQLIWQDSLEQKREIYKPKQEDDFGGFSGEEVYGTGLFFQDLAFGEDGNSISVLVGNQFVRTDSEEELEDVAMKYSFSLQKRAIKTGEVIEKLSWNIPKMANWSAQTSFVDANTVVTSTYQIGAGSEDIHKVWLLSNKNGKAESKVLKTVEKFANTSEYVIAYNQDSLNIFNKLGELQKSLKAPEKVGYIKIQPANDGYLEIYFTKTAYEIHDIKNLLAGEFLPRSILFSFDFAGNWKGKYHLMNAERNAEYVTGVKLIDSETDQVLLEYYHSKRFIEAQFSPKGTYLASSSEDKTIRFRKMENLAVNAIAGNSEKKKPKREIQAHEKYAYKQVGKTLIFWGDNELEWDVEETLTYYNSKKMDSLFPEVDNYLGIADRLLIIEGKGTLEDLLYEGVLFEQIYFSEKEQKIYAVDENIITSIDIKTLNQIATLHNQNPKEKWIKKQIWNSWSKAKQENFNQSISKKSESKSSWKDATLPEMAMFWFPIDNKSELIFLEAQNQFLEIDSNRFRLINASDMSLIQESGAFSNKFSIAQKQNRLKIEFSENGQQLFVKEFIERYKPFYELISWDLTQNKIISTQTSSVWDLQQTDSAFALANGDSIEIYRNGSFTKYVEHSPHETFGIYNSWWLEKNVLVQYSDSGITFHGFGDKKPLFVDIEVVNNVKSYAFSQDQKQLFVYSGKEVILFDWETRKPVQKWILPFGFIKSIATIPDSNQIITTHKDHAMRVWDMSEKLPKLVKTYFGNDFESAYYDSDKKRIVSKNNSGEERVLLEWEF